MKLAGKCRKAAKGVILSGFRKDEDCKPIELWRNPLVWVPKVQSVKTLISQAKGQRLRPFYRDLVCFFLQIAFLYAICF